MFCDRLKKVINSIVKAQQVKSISEALSCVLAILEIINIIEMNIRHLKASAFHLDPSTSV